jgi:SCP1.201-like deaminase
MPKGAAGFNGHVRTHAEGHAVATMIREGVTEATLYLNNQRICSSCEKFLRFEVRRRGLKLDVVLPNGITRRFGVTR